MKDVDLDWIFMICSDYAALMGCSILHAFECCYEDMDEETYDELFDYIEANW